MSEDFFEPEPETIDIEELEFENDHVNTIIPDLLLEKPNKALIDPVSRKKIRDLPAKTFNVDLTQATKYMEEEEILELNNNPSKYVFSVIDKITDRKDEYHEIIHTEGIGRRIGFVLTKPTLEFSEIKYKEQNKLFSAIVTISSIKQEEIERPYKITVQCSVCHEVLEQHRGLNFVKITSNKVTCPNCNIVKPLKRKKTIPTMEGTISSSVNENKLNNDQLSSPDEKHRAIFIGNTIDIVRKYQSEVLITGYKVTIRRSHELSNDYLKPVIIVVGALPVTPEIKTITDKDIDTVKTNIKNLMKKIKNKKIYEAFSNINHVDEKCPVDVMIRSFYPELVGREIEKIVLFHSLVGAENEIDAIKTQKINRLHTMLVGGPATGKTVLVRRLKESIIQTATYLDVTMTSRVGLIGGLNKDGSFSFGKVSTYPIIMLDEFDKFAMNPSNSESITALYQIMTSGTYQYNMAGLKITAKTDNTFVFVANPRAKSGRDYFMKNTSGMLEVPFMEHITSFLPKAFVSRIHYLVWIHKIDEETYYKALHYTLMPKRKRVHTELDAWSVLASEINVTETSEWEKLLSDWVYISKSIIPKGEYPDEYFMEKKHKMNKELKEMGQKIIDKVVSSNIYEDEETAENVLMSYVRFFNENQERTVDAIIGLSIAHAKLHLRNRVTKHDIDYAFSLFKKIIMNNIGINYKYQKDSKSVEEALDKMVDEIIRRIKQEEEKKKTEHKSKRKTLSLLERFVEALSAEMNTNPDVKKEGLPIDELEEFCEKYGLDYQELVKKLTPVINNQQPMTIGDKAIEKLNDKFIFV